VKERPRTACDTPCAKLKESYPNIYTALTILATMPVSAATAEIFQPAEKTEDLAAKRVAESSVDWTRCHELSARNNIDVDIDQDLRDLISSITVEFCLLR